jgi:hypothetical protein
MALGDSPLDKKIEMDTRRLSRATAVVVVTAMAIGFTAPGATQVTAHAEHAAEVGQLRLDNGRKCGSRTSHYARA